MSENKQIKDSKEEDAKLSHRKHQLHNLMELIETVQAELQTAINHNKTLNKRKGDLQGEFSTYDLRLQSILK